MHVAQWRHSHIGCVGLNCFCTCVCLPLQTLVSNNVSLSLSAAVALAAAQQPIPVTQQQQEAVLDFVGRRLEQLLIDAGVSAEAGGSGCSCGFEGAGISVLSSVSRAAA